MFQRVMNFYQKIYYIQIWEERIKVVDVDTGHCFDEKPYLAIESTAKGARTVKEFGNIGNSGSVKIINPFSHPRALFSDFHVAGELLRLIIKDLQAKTRINISPKIVIHPMEKIEGGLTMMERRAFIELGHEAGAKEVVIYTGPEINRLEINYKFLKSQDEAHQNDYADKKPKANTALILIMLIILTAMIFAINNVQINIAS